MNHRPYPRIERARNQIERATYLKGCPLCGHAVVAHAVEDGQRVCTWGEGVRTSCRQCAELWTCAPAAAAFQEFARVLSRRPERTLLEA